MTYYNTEKRVSHGMFFNKFISNIIVEVEGIKLKAMKGNFEEINEHLVRINSALCGITDAKIDLAKTC